MKKFVTLGFILFIFAVVAIMLIGSKSKGPNSVIPGPIVKGASTSLNLDLQEIAKHNSINDCWMILESKVYNITQVLQIHPAGADVILPYCGKDGVKGFTTKDSGSGKNHSQNTYALLNNFYIGEVGQTINTGKTNVPTILPDLLRENDEEFE